MDGDPCFRNYVLEAIMTCPEVLEVESLMGWRYQGAVEQERAMVGDDRGEATQVALAVELLPIRSAEDPVQMDKHRGRLPVRPCVAASIEVNLFERKVVEHASKSTHHPAVDVAIVFVFVTVNKVEVTTQHPWSRALDASVAEFLQEGDLASIFLWAVDDSDPPGNTCSGRSGNPGR